MKKNTKDKKNNLIKKGKANKFVKIALALILIIAVIYAVYLYVKLLIVPVSKSNIVYGKISDETSNEAYIVRDEIILDTNYTTDINLIKTEGSRVGKNEKVGMYVNQNKEQWEEIIKQLDIKIQDAMKEQNNLSSNDIQRIENQIEILIQNINTCNQVQLIEQYQTEINQLLTKKAKITGELSPSGSYIKELIQQRIQYETSLNESTNYIKTSISGVVSTKIDGQEEKFSINRIKNVDENISYKELEKYNIRTDEIIATNRKKIKIVDNYYCYLIVNISGKHKDYLSVDSKLKVRLNNGNVISAMVYKVIDEENSKTVVLKITEDVEYLLDYRKISLDIIWWEYEGWKIPNKFIKFEQIQTNAEVPYVNLKKYNKEYTVYIEIKERNEEYSIIENISENSIEKYGLKDKVNKELALYDELIIK